MKVIRAVEGLVVFLLVSITLLAMGFYLFASVLNSNSLMPVVFGSVSATIGLVCNLSFSYARTLDGELASALNERAGRLVAVVSYMVICTIATIPSLTIKSLKSGTTPLVYIVDAVIFFSSFMAAVVFAFLVLFAVIDLPHISNFILFAKKGDTSALKYKSPYEKFIYYTMERASKHFGK